MEYEFITQAISHQKKQRKVFHVEAPNVDNRPKEEDLQYIFKNITEIKERNIQIALLMSF